MAPNRESRVKQRRKVSQRVFYTLVLPYSKVPEQASKTESPRAHLHKGREEKQREDYSQSLRTNPLQAPLFTQDKVTEAANRICISLTPSQHMKLGNTLCWWIRNLRYLIDIGNLLRTPPFQWELSFVHLINFPISMLTPPCSCPWSSFFCFMRQEQGHGPSFWLNTYAYWN
jgi:hypothetical protein